MSISDKLGITKGVWESMELDDGKYLICSGTLSLLSIHNEYDPTTEKHSLWGIFNTKQDSIICAAAPEMLEALIDYFIKDDSRRSRYGAGIISKIKRNHYKNVIEKATGKTWQEIKELLDE